MDKENGVYIYIYTHTHIYIWIYSAIKTWNLAIFDHTHGLCGDYAKWNMSDPEKDKYHIILFICII